MKTLTTLCNIDVRNKGWDWYKYKFLAFKIYQIRVKWTIHKDDEVWIRIWEREEKDKREWGEKPLRCIPYYKSRGKGQDKKEIYCILMTITTMTGWIGKVDKRF